MLKADTGQWTSLFRFVVQLYGAVLSIDPRAQTRHAQFRRLPHHDGVAHFQRRGLQRFRRVDAIPLTLARDKIAVVQHVENRAFLPA